MAELFPIPIDASDRPGMAEPNRARAEAATDLAPVIREIIDESNRASERLQTIYEREQRAERATFLGRVISDMAL